MSQSRTNSEPARGPAEVVDLSSGDWTPSNTMKGIARCLWVGTGGNLKVDLYGENGGTTVGIDFPNVPAGWWEGSVSKVYKNGTTADDIRAVS